MAEKKPEKGGGEAAKGSVDTSSATGLLGSAVKAALPIVVSAVVSVGFVAFAGKAILWTRFKALQVPADQVVKVVPQSEAIATGASLLLIFGLLGVLAAVAIYLVDRGGRATPGMSRGLLAVFAAEALVAIWLADGKSAESRVIASELVLLALGVIFWSTFVRGLVKREVPVPGRRGDRIREEAKVRAFYQEPKDGTPTSGIEPMGAVAAVAIALALGGFVFLIFLIFGASGQVALIAGLPSLAAGLVGAILFHLSRCDRGRLERERKEAVEARERKEKEDGKKRAKKERKKAEKRLRREADLRAELALRSGLRRRRLKPDRGGPLLPAETKDEPDGGTRPPGVRFVWRGLALAIAMVLVIVAIPPLILHEWWLAVALGSIAVLGAGLWRISRFGITRFVWYGLAVFISVPLFGTVLLIARNVDEPQVQPLALIRTTDGPDEAIQGLYVTETGKRVYFANVATEGCEEDVVRDSGRLLSVPKDEVVAMEIGPLQSVRQAGRSALEMSYDLTPGIETVGATVDLPGATSSASGQGAPGGASPDTGATGAAGPTGTTGSTGAARETGATGKAGATEATTATSPRLEDVGPAVRPYFGRGLRVEPETVSPGGEATLRMSQENKDVEGFGRSRAGHNLRLGGRVLDIAKESAGTASGAEYIELENGRLIRLAKEVAFEETMHEDFVPEGEAAEDEVVDEGPFVRIEDPVVLKPDEGSNAAFVKVEEVEGSLVVGEEKSVTLAGGELEGETWEAEEELPLKGRPLLRQAWHTDHIRFHVPEDARTGVVAAECDQLAGAPLLQVRHAPDAHIAVRVPRRKASVTFDGRKSVVGPPAHALPPPADGKKAPKLTWSWKVDGVRQGHRKLVRLRMAPRMAPYEVELTVTDREGVSDTAKLQVLRLPSFALAGLKKRRAQRRKKIREALEAARGEIEQAAADERPTAVELDGYTDSPGRVDPNARESLALDGVARGYFLREREDESEESTAGRRAIPVEELGHGERCPLTRHPTPARRHVDVFLLHQGVVVRAVKKCHALVRKSDTWHPRFDEEEESQPVSATG